MKLSLMAKCINPVWIKKTVKVGDIVKYDKLYPVIYYCRIIDIDCAYIDGEKMCHGHFVKNLKDIDIEPGLNDGAVLIKCVKVLK